LRFAIGLQICSRKAFCKKRSKVVIHPKELKRNKVLAVWAVIGELVSVAPFSLFCGKIQGNSSNLDWGRRLTLFFAVEIQSFTSRIP
jgi:hypothetical protein